MAGKKRGLVILDEFGDGFFRHHLDEETQGFLNLDQYFILPVENLVISMHPDLLDSNNNRPVEGVIGKEEFSEHALHSVMRNTTGIVQHHKDLGYTTFTHCIPLTVEGPAPVLLKGNFNHPDFYQQCLKTVTRNNGSSWFAVIKKSLTEICLSSWVLQALNYLNI